MERLSPDQYPVVRANITSEKVAIDKEFARKARISPSELFMHLPEDWENMMQWTMANPYQL